MDTSLLGHRERIIELAEILFELCKDTDESSQLNNLSMPEGYPYFSLLAIQATVWLCFFSDFLLSRLPEK